MRFEKLTILIKIDTDHSLNYIGRQCISCTDIILTVHEPYDCLRQMYDAKQAVLRRTEGTYEQIFNACIRIYPTGIRRKEGERIEGRIRRSCLIAKKKSVAKVGQLIGS